jgi:hypothetical protein
MYKWIHNELDQDDWSIFVSHHVFWDLFIYVSVGRKGVAFIKLHIIFTRDR